MTAAPEPTVSAVLAKRIQAICVEPLPEYVVTASRLRVLDALTCMALGAGTASGRAAVRLAERWSPPDGTVHVIGHDRAFMPPWTAFVHGVAAHTLELDDAHDATSVQPGAAVVATALALCESNDVSGDTFLRAVLAGYEVSLALGLWFAPEHKELGYHPTATLTTIGATATACVAAGADEATCRAALEIATSMAGGLLEFARAGGTVNHLHTGKAALLGVFAADAAAHGFSGAGTAFEGQWGMHRVLGGRAGSSTWPGIGDGWRVAEVISKPYPTCRAAHPAIAAAGRLHADFVQRGMPAEVVVKVPQQSFRQTNQPHPAGMRERQFSSQYGVAAALTSGTVTLRDITNDNRAAPLTPLMQRVRLVVDDSVPASARSAAVSLHYGDEHADVDESPRIGGGQGAAEIPEDVLRRRLDVEVPARFERLNSWLTGVCSRQSLRGLSEEFGTYFGPW
jgi:2-methylcitrate dehydratase PrpD